MRFSFGWLKRHLVTTKSISEIADILTSIGIEVEEVIDYNDIFKNFVVARVENVRQHPNANKLHLCDAILHDSSVRHVVCGAANVRNGLNVVLALPGAKIPVNGEVLKQSKIRGEISEGMFCSYEELGLAKESDGIIELPIDVDLDAKVVDLLGVGDGIIDVSITPNRGDCFSLSGIARDLAAAKAGVFVPECDTYVKGSCKFDAEISLSNTVPLLDIMPFCAYRVIHGVQNKDAPEWVSQLLKSADISSISAIVDFANFMTFDVCRPFHIYDLNKIKNKLNIRYANNGEVFTSLNGQKYVLNSDTVVASDSSDCVMCVLGIMGAEDCSCDENTTDILIEAAVFNPIYISNCGNRINIKSDSRSRFERGIDAEYTLRGLHKITDYIVNYCGGQASDIYTIGELNPKRKRITIKSEDIDRIAGIKIDFNDALDILKRLQIGIISNDKSEAICEVPSFRSDLVIKEDLVEEVLRIKGYESIPLNPLPVDKNNFDKTVLNKYKQINEIKRMLCGLGLSELLSFSFINQKQAKCFMSDLIHTSQQLVVIANPISEELAVMRNSLYPMLLANVSNMFNLSAKSGGLFEIGPVFSAPNIQRNIVAGVLSGKYAEKNWIDDSRDYDVYDTKSIVLRVLKMLNINEDKIAYNVNIVPEWYHPARSSAIMLNKKIVGYFGELHPNISDFYGIKSRCMGFELDLDLLLGFAKKRTTDYNNNKVLQPVERDFSFVFDSSLGRQFQVRDLIQAIKKSEKMIAHVGVFDYYKIDDASIALGVTVTIQPEVATLKDNEIRKIYDNIICVANALGCELRQ